MFQRAVLIFCLKMRLFFPSMAVRDAAELQSSFPLKTGHNVHNFLSNITLKKCFSPLKPEDLW